MKTNKPARTCIACRKECEKSQLVRIVKTPKNLFMLDLSGKADGRGAYVCCSESCINKLVKGKLLNRAFKQNVPDEFYNGIKEQILGKKE